MVKAHGRRYGLYAIWVLAAILVITIVAVWYIRVGGPDEDTAEEHGGIDMREDVDEVIFLEDGEGVREGAEPATEAGDPQALD